MPVDTKCSALLELKMYCVKARVEMAIFGALIKLTKSQGNWDSSVASAIQGDAVLGNPYQKP